jgi:hypothetical protein
MRSRTLVGLGAVAALALVFGWVLSLATSRVKNWFVMSDELYYERLAISVAQTGSLLPRVHGELVSNVNQLYPVLLSLVYGDGDVPASLAAAHRLNAFVIASAAVPVYLLARRVGIGMLLSIVAGALAAAVPWVVLSSFLLTEVVAYPVFCWALLALVHAVERQSWVWDGVALLAIGAAVLARTQFLVLLAVLAVAVIGEALLTTGVRDLWSRRRPLVLVYALLAAVILVAFASGNGSRLLGSYAVTAENLRLDTELIELAFAHAATMALALAVVPFVVGLGWLVDRIRPSAAPVERAFALVGAAAFALTTVQVASFTQRFGFGLVKERYLFYVAPVVLVAVAAAIGSRRWPRWWALALPAAVAALGFVWIPVAPYEKLNVDTPVAMLNDGLLDLATSENWARALLVLLTLVALQALLLARAALPWRPVAAAAGALLVVALPLETAYAFERLFRVDGTNGLPVTLDQGVVFNWIDRQVGPSGRVTVFKYPVGGPDWWAGQAYWWDVEFWNESAVRVEADMSLPSAAHWSELFDPRTGLSRLESPTPYVLSYGEDARFRLAGRQLTFDRGAYLIEAERPWRVDWLTRGIQPDGFTHPGEPVEIAIFPQPGQATPLKRFVTVAVKAPDGTDAPVSLRGGLTNEELAVPSGVSVDRQLAVCVPPDAPAELTLETPVRALAHRDPTKAALTGEVDRPVGVQLRIVALADETEPMERCPS